MGFGRIFLFILVFAIVEVMVLAAAADVIGWPITIALVVLTALVGSALFRHQGLETWKRLNQRVNQGEMPGRELVEGIMLLLGGALLITPGFISDATGLVLLLPVSRRALAARLIRRGTVQAFTTGSGGGAFFYQSRGGASGGGPFGHHRPANDDSQGEIIEGEARSEDDPSIKGPR